MSTEGWSPIPSATYADLVYDRVRDRVLGGEMAPGEFLRENELALALGVSRTPVREALARLASEGFLERIPHRGFRVPPQPVSQLLDLYPVVSALELLAGRLAFRQLQPGQIEQLRRVNEQLRKAIERKDVRRAMELNNQFHDLIAQWSGNQELGTLLNGLRSRLKPLEIWYYSYRNHGEKSIRQHHELIELLEQGNHEQALSIFESNMRLTHAAFLEEVGTGGRDPTGPDQTAMPELRR